MCKSFRSILCLLLALSIACSCFLADPITARADVNADSSTEATEAEEIPQLPDKVRSIAYAIRITKKAPLYRSYKARKKSGYSVAKGTVLRVHGKKNGRIKVSINGKYYYVKTRYTRYVSADYTNKKYTTKQKLNFVQKYSSKTPYLIWISLYTQEVNIFQGRKGNWTLIKTFPCASGSPTHRTPKGVFKIHRKDRIWDFYNRYELWVTRFAGKNSFHTRVHRKDTSMGEYYWPELGAPISSGCIRLLDEDAKFIYDKMPMKTTVVSY